ncbi:MAG: hypothetical protein J0I29_13710, partial [Rhizobiales bacterium]|nr:hypothetical protein [Hyphomicrobiales bacterium]
PTGPTMWLCLRWLHAVRLKGGEIRPDERRLTRLSDPAPGRAVPPPKIPQHSGLRRLRKLVCAWRAERRCVSQTSLSQAKREKRAKTVAPFGASCPSPRTRENATHARKRELMRRRKNWIFSHDLKFLAATSKMSATRRFARLLNRWARHRAKRTEYAAVASQWLELQTTTFANIEKLAGIRRHRLDSLMLALRADDGRFENATHAKAF